MYLEKLTIQGFKSFAGKYQLSFPGQISKDKHGVTAIVGPNGSGKSNIADSIRWVLGEQSMKTLRGKKSEDVIFAGSDKKGQLSMAEVSLHLNNADKKGGIEYSEIVLTRRLYRSGESEYILNGSRTRLSDIQMLLAKANFGQRTYSVVGQGTVEGFLNTTLADRKEFFDEATGVKQFQIKRDTAINKLSASYENLDQVEMLLNEIEPRLKSLTRQVNKLRRRGEIEVELRDLQIKYYGTTWHEIKNKYNQYTSDFLAVEKEKIEKDRKLEKLNFDLDKIEKEQKVDINYDDLQNALLRLQESKDIFVKQLAKIDAQIEVKLESEGKFDLSWLNGKKSELEEEIKRINEEVESLQKKIASDTTVSNEYLDEKRSLDQKLSELNNLVISLKRKLESPENIKINDSLKKYISKLEEIVNESDINILRQKISEIKNELKTVLSQIEQEDEKEKIDEIQERIISLTNAKEEVVSKINDNQLRISARSERVKLLNEKFGQLQGELININNKLKQYHGQENNKVSVQDREEAVNKIANIDIEIKDKRSRLEEIKMQEEQERAKIFTIQKNIQALQAEVNNLTNQLSDNKVKATRYETKLEDLETEIRQSLGSLKEVKMGEVQNEIDLNEIYGRISNLKKQLEQIGGIDPETEKEYNETKERYDFLFAQSSDLNNAIESLEKVIKELDISIKEKFDKEFKLISDKFQEYFQILFNGGKAKIVKVMEEEMEEIKQAEQMEETANTNQVNELEAEIKKDIAKEEKADEKKVDLKRIKFLKKHNATGLAGIEIQANPPGKKIQLLSMLSGGERALTTIALICAIISANPSPFVVLDEVDAALDEANSERLAQILKDLSSKTQFIVITHNRASMKVADVLYGVSMQNDGISKMLSVKLEDVKFARQ